MASKAPIEARMVSWFALAPPEDAKKAFQTIRAVLNDRKLLGRGAGQAKTKRAVRTVAPAQAVSGTQEA